MVAAGISAAALVCVGASVAADPRAVLIGAGERTNAARSFRVSLVEHVTVAGRGETISLSGVQQPASKDGSFALAVSPAQAGLGTANEILRGANVYVHYPILDTLHAKDPSIRTWILVNTKSSLGLNPASFSVLQAGELQELTGVEAEGASTIDGQAVTDYAGTLNLSQAAKLPAFAQLLSHLPSASAAILNGPARITYAVGRDGLVHRVAMTISARVQGVTLKVVLDMTLADFNRASAPIAAPPASQVMTLQQFDQLIGAGSTATETALLQRVVLKPTQVGSGYVLSQVPGGHLVQGETTLDFCGYTYASEGLRTARLQVLYSAPHDSFEASNEVVTYAPGGPQAALNEVRQAAARCPNGPVKNPPSGVSNLVRQTQLVSDPTLLPGAVAILQTDSGTVHGKHVTDYTMAVYQIRGSVLSGVYGYGNSAMSVRKRTLHAAEQSARNLKEYVGSGSTALAGPGLTA